MTACKVVKQRPKNETYKPTQPGDTSIVAKNVIHGPTTTGSAVRPRDQEDHIQSYPNRQCPILLKLIPVIRINLFPQPQEEVQRIQVGLDALRQRSTANKPGGHDEDKRKK